MKRRSFLVTSLTAFGSFLVARSGTLHERIHNLWGNLTGPSKVENARPIPPFTQFNIPRGTGMRFLVLGDWGTGGVEQRDVAASMVRTASEYGCDYVISVGDNIYPNGVASADDEQWKRKFERVYHDQGLTQPFYATLGNHDYRLDPDAQIAYGKKNPQWQMPAHYYTRLLQAPDGTTVQLFSLDTQPVATGVEGAAREQREWLEGELKKSTARWKIVFGHHMLYSNGVYGNLSRLRAAFESTFVAGKVPLYLCGHDHDIQLLKPVDGVNYVVSGGGGGHRDTSWRDNTIYAATNMGYVWMAATGDGLYLHFHDAEGRLKYAHRVA